MPHFAQQRNGLQPTKALFDALPFLLAEAVARLPAGAPIDGAAVLRPRFCATCGVIAHYLSKNSLASRFKADRTCRTRQGLRHPPRRPWDSTGTSKTR